MASADREFLGNIQAEHCFAHRLFPEVPNAVDFKVGFNYALISRLSWAFKRGFSSDDGPNLATRLKVISFIDTTHPIEKPFGPIKPKIRHVGYGKAMLDDTIEFETDARASSSRFILEIGPRDAEWDDCLIRIDLGTYDRAPSGPADLIHELIAKRQLCKLPVGLRVFPVAERSFTNVLPAANMVQRPDEEIAQRLAVLTAAMVRSRTESASVWVWSPTGEPDKATVAMHAVDSQFARCARQVADAMSKLGGIKPIPQPSDEAVVFGFFQSVGFTKSVLSTGLRGLCVFGFRGVEPTIESVIDLHDLPRMVTSPHVLKKLLHTADERHLWLLGLQELMNALDPASGISDENIWFSSSSELDEVLGDLSQKVSHATLHGTFLNSEPRFVQHWIDLSQLHLGREGLLLAAGEAIQSVGSRLSRGERPIVVNLIGGLAEEFPMIKDLEAADLGLDDVERGWKIANITFRNGEPACKPGEACKSLANPNPTSVIVLTPIDTYVEPYEQILDWLAINDNAVVGVVPLISAANSRRLHPGDWSAEYVPVVRVMGDECIINLRATAGDIHGG